MNRIHDSRHLCRTQYGLSLPLSSASVACGAMFGISSAAWTRTTASKLVFITPWLTHTHSTHIQAPRWAAGSWQLASFEIETCHLVYDDDAQATASSSVGRSACSQWRLNEAVIGTMATNFPLSHNHTQLVDRDDVLFFSFASSSSSMSVNNTSLSMFIKGEIFTTLRATLPHANHRDHDQRRQRYYRLVFAHELYIICMRANDSVFR